MAHKERQPENSSSQKGRDSPNISFSADTKRAAVGGGVAAVIALTGMLVVNISSGSEARLLLEGMLPSVRFLCSAVMTATATVLALMLTLLSFSSSADPELKSQHYSRVRQIAKVDSGTFAAALVLLLLLSVPLADTSEVPANWYAIVYYIAVVYTAALGGALITVVMMLYNAINDLIRIIDPQEESELIMDGD